MDTRTDYGALQGLGQHKINSRLIAEHWDNLLRLAGSLKLGTVQATDILLSLTQGKTLTALGRASAELGRIAKTLHLLEYIQDEDYRRRILIQLNRGELRNMLARTIHYGHKGEVRERYKQGQEDHLGALGLVDGAVALWNSRYLQAVLDWLEVVDDPPAPEDVARLSPLRFEHIHMRPGPTGRRGPTGCRLRQDSAVQAKTLGRYPFELHQDVQGGALRPLRDPDTLEPWEDWRAVP